jgi:phosphate transport system substrate-binding protein
MFLIKRFATIAGALVIATSALLAPVAAVRAATNLTGAGSSFDYPFFNKAFTTYCGGCVNYQPIGSGAGIQQFTAKTVDFGATDVPLDPTSELKAAVKAGGPVIQIAITLGGVAVAYNLPNIKSGLRLTGPVLAEIYLGLITHWNDSAIRKLNPKLKLPTMPIAVVHRSDSSGTSFIFTDYLSKVSDQWRGRVGTGKSPNWPTGVGGKGSAGVAQIVQSTSGGIGYVELSYALENGITYAAVLNRGKQFVLPARASVAAAASKYPNVNALNFSIVDAPGKLSYPICGYSWVLLWKNNPDASKGAALKKLFQWMLTSRAQGIAATLDYVPLPKKTVAKGQLLLKTMK